MRGTTAVRALAVIGMMVLSLAGCGAVGEPSGYTSTSSAGTALTKEQAAVRYLEIVEEFNEIADVWVSAMESADLDVMRDAADRRAAAARAMSDALRGERWPAEVQGEVDRVVAHMAEEIEANVAAQQAEDAEGFHEAIAEIPPDDSSQRVREVLGLPDVPAD